MNKKESKFLDKKLLELTQNNIITEQQYVYARQYFSYKKENKSVTLIFSAIGVLLIAISIITLFAINWVNISKNVKIVISFIPIIITSILLYLYMKNQNKKMQIYTSIFAPLSIIATNSLIEQIFHIQAEIYELIFLSLIMFLPIAFILRNYISLIVYGIGTIIYAYFGTGRAINENYILINTLLLTIPLIIFNIVNYIKNKNDGKNIAVWFINLILITLLLINKEIIGSNEFIIYMYMLYLITITIFKNIKINKFLSFIFFSYLIISCISTNSIYYVDDIYLSVNVLVISILSAIFIYLSQVYKDPKQYFIFAFIVVLQYLRIDTNVIFIILNIIAISYGIYKIILGYQANSNKEIKQGVALILILILFRFLNADMSFMAKSIMFLIAGISFIVGSYVMNKKIGGSKDE